MKLYYAPGACSLASHIALHEAGLEASLEKVDLKSKRTEAGGDYLQINPKGYVPALQLDDGAVLTENIAVLRWISDRGDLPAPSGDLGPYRLLETLAFISSEIHKAFKPFFSPDAGESEKTRAAEMIGKRLDFIATRWRDDFLFGASPGAADAYLFVMLFWAGRNNLNIPSPLPQFVDRMKARPAVRLALEHEGLG